MAGERKGLILIIVAMLAATGLAVIASRDYTSPAVSWVVPVADGVAVDPGAAIIATFSEDIDPASIGINSLRLSAKGAGRCEYLVRQVDPLGRVRSGHAA